MIRSSYERLLASVMFVMLIVAIMSYSLAWVNMPSWNVVLKSMASAGDNDASRMFMEWVRSIGVGFSNVPDIPRVPVNSIFGDILNAIVGLYNLMWKLSVGFFYLLGLAVSYIGYTFSFVIPAMTQFAALFGESIGTSFGHFGNTSPIDWNSLSSDYGYVDGIDISSLLDSYGISMYSLLPLHS